jgi:RNA polymerase sigma-70 factor (ECF subfamily)
METAQRHETWEGHLVRRAQMGDAMAFEHLVDLFRPTLRNHAMNLLRRADDAEDAVQETFVKAYRAIAGFDSSRNLLPWLMRICSNCCIDIVRDRKRNTTQPIEALEHWIEDPEANVGESVEARSSARAIAEAVARLPRKYREVVEMRHVQHRSVLEISEVTGAPEGTVKSWLHRARALLARDLQIQSPA